jgi:hypothetical protein
LSTFRLLCPGRTAGDMGAAASLSWRDLTALVYKAGASLPRRGGATSFLSSDDPEKPLLTAVLHLVTSVSHVLCL